MKSLDAPNSAGRDGAGFGRNSSSRSVRFIAPEIESASLRQARWSSVSEIGLKPDSFISAEECVRAPIIAAYARRNILTAIYGRDIHGDILDIDAVARRILSRQERIVFWGEREPIAALRAALSHAPAENIDSSSVRYELGTATLGLADEFFGEGAWELSRTGSISAKADATAAHIAMLHEYLEADCGPEIVFAITRNEERHGSLPGGTAIHRLHARGLRSVFLGARPSWHELLPGALQVYDFRAIFRDPDAVLERIGRVPAPVFARAGAAEFANAIIALSNLGAVRAKVWRQGCKGAELQFVAHSVGGFADCVHKRTFISFRAHGGCPIDALSSECWDEFSCIAVRMSLVVEGIGVQDWLERRGFRFCALEPPRDQASWIGYWCRPCANMDFNPPYYLLRALPSSEETALAGAISKIMTDWKNWSTARHV